MKKNPPEHTTKNDLHQLEKRYTYAENRLDKIENRLDKIDDRLKSIDKNIDVSEKLLRMEIRMSSDSTVRQILESISEFKSLILTTVDPLLKELEERREDRAVATYQTEELKQQVIDVQKRLSKLEKLQHVA